MAESTSDRHTLLKRFQNFYRQLQCCNKEAVLQLMRIQESDNRSVFGRNCAYIKSRLGVQHVPDGVIDSIPVFSVPVGCEWKLPVISDLMDFKRGLSHIGDFSLEETCLLLNRLCSN